MSNDVSDRDIIVCAGSIEANTAIRVAGVIELRCQATVETESMLTKLGGVRMIGDMDCFKHSDQNRFTLFENPQGENPFAFFRGFTKFDFWRLGHRSQP